MRDHVIIGEKRENRLKWRSGREVRLIHNIYLVNNKDDFKGDTLMYGEPVEGLDNWSNLVRCFCQGYKPCSCILNFEFGAILEAGRPTRRKLQ